MSKVLGYTHDGKPIEPIPEGLTTTRAFVHCCTCHAPIRSHGGPIRNAYCLTCWKKETMNNEKGPTTLPEDAAALVVRADGAIELMFPDGGEEDEVSSHCLLIAALGAMCSNDPEQIQDIVNSFWRGEFSKKEKESVGSTE